MHIAIKNLKRFLVIAAVILLGGNSGYALVIRNYFPVYEGSFWNFTQTDSKAVCTWAINGSVWLKDAGKVFIMLQDGNRLLCMREDWEGLRIYAEFEPGKFCLPEKPLLFMPRVIEADPAAPPVEESVTMHSYTDTDGWKNFKHTGKETRKITVHMVGYEDIRVAQQTFRDCIIIVKTTHDSSGVTTEKMWLAPNIGPVRRDVHLGGTRIRSSIKSYHNHAPSNQRRFSLQDYFPLQSGTTWTYRDQAGKLATFVAKEREKAKLMDLMITPFADSADNIYYVTTDARGLVLQQWYIPDSGILVAFPATESAAVMLPAVLSPGSFFRSRTYPRSYVLPNMTLSLTRPDLAISSIPVCTEDVTVPAGTYKDSIKLCLFFLADTPTLQFDFFSIGFVWLARGIGIVKQNKLTVMHCDLPESSHAVWEARSWELVSIQEASKTK